MTARELQSTIGVSGGESPDLREQLPLGNIHPNALAMSFHG